MNSTGEALPANVKGMTTPTLLDLRAAAELVGVSYRTMRNYHQTAERNRRQGEVRPGDLPEPDDTFGRSPVWKRQTITAWKRHRPGRGAGGGRPRKATPAAS